MTHLAALLHMPLKDSYLCQSCEHVGNSANWCPYCSASSTYLLSLSKVLNRAKESK